MARRLTITPEGVGEQLEPSIHDIPTAAGRNQAIVRNDHYDVAADGTYTNTE